MTVKTCVISGYGINADRELQEAFILAGSQAERRHVQELIESPENLAHYHIVAFPGGFSFGDHLGSGLVFAHLFRKHLKTQLEQHLAEGKLIIGICNGFQVLVKMGVLPNLNKNWEPQVSLIHNDSGVFEDSWVTLTGNTNSQCVWTRGIESIELPIRHGEGRFLFGTEATRSKMEKQNLVALRYADRNPNGSDGDVAGITDPTGRILGLMPHPEAFLYPENHPRWTREPIQEAAGLRLFVNGVNYIKENDSD